MPKLNQAQHLAIARQKARLIGYRNPVEISTRRDKKYMIVNNQGRLIHFGAKGYSDFILHRNQKRRANYRKRHGAILSLSGVPSYKIHGSPAHLAYYVLW